MSDCQFEQDIFVHSSVRTGFEWEPVDRTNETKTLFGASVPQAKGHRCGMGQNLPAVGRCNRLLDRITLIALGVPLGFNGQPGHPLPQKAQEATKNEVG